jgi:hypothetical protein
MALLVGAELDRQLTRVERRPWLVMIAAAVIMGSLLWLLPWKGYDLAEPLGATDDARRLASPVILWLASCWLMVFGATLALAGRVRWGLGAVTAAQTAVLLTVLFGIFPILSPYLGGAEAHLAAVAARELPESEVVLYDTRPEAVAFALERIVPVYDQAERDQLAARLRRGPVALIAPARAEHVWDGLRVREVSACGDRVLLHVPQAVSDSPSLPTP